MNVEHRSAAPAIGPRPGGALLVVGVLVLAAGALLQTIGGVTGAMRVAGCPAGTPVALQSGPGGADADTRAHIVTGWHAWERTAEGATVAADAPACASVPRPDGPGAAAIVDDGPDAPGGATGAPSALAAAQRWFDVDVAFAVLYGTWLLLALLWVRNGAPPGGEPGPRADRRADQLGTPLRWLVWRVTRWPVVPLLPVGAALADVFENLALRGQLASWWRVLDREGVLTATDVATPTVLAAAVAAAGIVKWVLAAASVVLVAVGVAPVGWRALRTIARSVPSMWLPMLAAVVFAVALAFLDQAADALRRLSVWQWITTLGVLAVFAATLATAAAGSLRPTATEGDRPGPPPPPRRAVLGDVALLAAAGLIGLLGVATGRHGVFVPAVLVALVAGVSLLLDVARWTRVGADALFEPVAGPPKPTGPTPDERLRVAAGIAVVPVLALGIATIGASTADTVLGVAPHLGAARRLVLGCLLVVAVAPAFVVVRRGLVRFAATATLRGRGLLLGGLVAVHLPFAAMHVPGIALGHAHRFGSVSLAMAFVSGFVLIPAAAATASYHAVRTRGLRLVALPTLLRVIGFRATPVLGLLVAWVVLASTVAYPGYHDVRRLADDPAAPGPLGPAAIASWTVDDMAQAWARRQHDDGPAAALVVAASGGGIRAAFYAAAALDCVIERDGPADDPCAEPADPATVAARRRALLALSGISGGSLGLASYVVAVESAGGWDSARDGAVDEPGAPLAQHWYRDRLGEDYLAPTIATWLYNDGLNALLRPRSGVGRGAILERAWERSWPGGELGAGFLVGQASGRQPVLLMNGFDVDDGCRVNTSIVLARVVGDPVDPARCRAVAPAGAAADPRVLLATTDVVAQLCPGDDLRYSTAALNSARFPFVSPAGRVPPCTSVGPGTGTGTLSVVDGGYRETSGASTIVELWPTLRPAIETALEPEPPAGDGPACVRPVFLQIDNGPEAAVDERRSDRLVPQWLAPAVALGASPGGQEAAARQASRALFGGDPADAIGGPGDPDAWFRIATFAHPGSSAPLGWVLSETAQADLERQLVLNAEAIAGIRAHLDDPPAC